MDAINLLEKAGLVDALWSPRVVGELNDVQVKVARIHGEFVWHDHQDTDELFLVIRGSMRVEYRERAVTLNEGEMHIVPKGIEHRTAADE
ncbi:MAG: cupin domain-containing protein, partial [Candidatus Poseidoniaceae archaeon]